MEDRILFQQFYKPYHDKFEDSLKGIGYNENLCLDSIQNYLYEELFSLSYLTLIHELNHYRDNGLLKGDFPESRYNSYEKLIGESTFFEYINNKYPALIYLMNKKLNHVIKTVSTIIQRFNEDKSSLEKKFNKKFIQIEDIKIGAGDSHEDGESVAILTGNFGKLIYKPNNLANDILWNDIIDALNPFLAFKLKKITILSRNNYAWQEYIEHKDCIDQEKISNYYHRLGVCLGLFYLLNACDYHHENLIAMGEYPMIVDTETLITARVKGSDILDTETYSLLYNNVLRTGLLPVSTLDSFFKVDISGLSGGNVEHSTIDVFEIENEYTDTMIVRKKNKEAIITKDHIPSFGNFKVDILDYIPNFIDGFKEVMEIVVDKKKEVKEWLDNYNFEKNSFRQVLRGTYVYASVLDAGNYPTYLLNQSERFGLFTRTLNKTNEERFKDEVNVMLEGNIPAYECKYLSKDLYRNGEIIQKNYFIETPQKVVENKLDNLSERIIDHQVKLINTSILTVLEEINISDEKIEVNRDGSLGLKDSIDNTFDTILPYIISIPSTDIKDLTQVMSNGDKFILTGSNFSLYEGGGLIWAIYCYGLEKEDESIQHSALCLLEKADVNYQKNIEIYREDCSAFSQTLGAVYLYFNFFKITNDEQQINKFHQYLETFSSMIEGCKEWDYISGMSGAIHLLCNIYNERPSEYLKKIIYLCKNQLVSLIQEDNENIDASGFAHGIHGLAIAYSDLSKIFDEQKFMDLSVQLLLKDIDESINDNKAWCNGLGGIVLAYADVLLKLSSDNPCYEDLKSKFHLILNQFMMLKSRNNICLCHGSSGELEILNELATNYSSLLSIEELQVIKTRSNEMVANLPKANGRNLGISLDLPLDTFMLGSSGVAYTRLRTINSEYPSVILLNSKK